MAYLIRIARRAARDLDHLYEEIHAAQSNAALTWYRGLKDAIISLEEHPARCPVTPETNKLRHLLYGKKPNIYREILHIRHGARQAFNPGSLT